MVKKIYCFLVMLLFGVNVYAQSIGGTTSGAATYCVGSGGGAISLIGHTGASIVWESSTDSVIWTPTGTVDNVNNFYLNLTQTTHYRAVVTNGMWPSDTSTVSSITVFAPADGGIITGAGVFCDSTGSGTLNTVGSVGSLDWEISIDTGNTWGSVGNITTFLNHGNITQHTQYRIIAQNGVDQFSVPCPEDTSAVVTFILDTPSDAGVVTSSDTICFGQNYDTLNISGQIGNVTDWIFSTDSGATWMSTGWADSIHYIYGGLIDTTWMSVVIKSGVCDEDTSAHIELWVVNLSPVEAGVDIVTGPNVMNPLNGVGVGTPLWTPATGLDDPNSFTPIASPNISTTYFLFLTDSNGCVSRDTLNIIVEIPIPDAFSPNNDGVNDFLVIDQVETFLKNSFTIYNRHGTVVYNKEHYQSEWDGRSNNGQNLPDGVYYYVLEFGNGSDPMMGYVIIKR